MVSEALFGQGPAASKRRVRLITAVVTLLALALIGVGATSRVVSKRSEALAAALDVVERLDETLQAHVDGQFRSAEAMNAVARYWLDAHPDIDPRDNAEFAALMDSFKEGTGGVARYRVISGDGKTYALGHSTDGSSVDISQTDNFKRVMLAAYGVPIITTPELSRIDGKRYLAVLTHIPPRKDGITVLSAAFVIDDLVALFDRARLQPNGTIVMIRTDGTVLARSPELPSDTPFPAVNKLLIDHIAQQPSPVHGVYEDRNTAADDLNRIVAYTTIGDRGVIIAVSAATSAVLAPWRREAEITIIGGSTLAVAIGGIAFWLVTLLGEAIDHAARLRESSALLVKAQEVARLNSFRIDVATGRWRSSGMPDDDWSVTSGVDNTEGTLEEFLTRVHPDDLDEVRACVDAAVVRGETVSVDFRMRGMAGAERYLHCVSIPERDEMGRLTTVLGIVQDITGRKALESELRDAKERAEEASQAKSNFLANMSHELRTPLNAIIGFSEVMRTEMLGPVTVPKYREYLGDIHTSAEHLLAIINDILDVARIEAGRFDLREGPVDLGQVLEDCARLVKPRADAVGLTLVLVVPDVLPHVVADERLIRQIVLNLVSNAIKFTPEGGRVELRISRGDQGDILIQVQDTGTGMTPSEIERAVQPFGRVHETSARNAEGVGLGLPLTRSFAVLHGGTMIIESVPRVGTTVTVSLPATRVETVTA